MHWRFAKVWSALKIQIHQHLWSFLLVKTAFSGTSLLLRLVLKQTSTHHCKARTCPMTLPTTEWQLLKQLINRITEALFSLPQFIIFSNGKSESVTTLKIELIALQEGLYSWHCNALRHKLEQLSSLSVLKTCKIWQQTCLLSGHAQYLTARPWKATYVPRIICLTLTTPPARAVKAYEKPQWFEQELVKGNTAVGTIFTGKTWLWKGLPLSPLWTEMSLYKCLKDRGGEGKQDFPNDKVRHLEQHILWGNRDFLSNTVFSDCSFEMVWKK